MAHAICADTPGGVEVLEWRDLPTANPGPGEVLIEQKRVGLNFIDVYMTSGTYPFPENGPQIPGGEAAGVVMAVGEGVSRFAVGDRVAYATPNGAYREERVLPEEKITRLPDAIDDETAAAAMLKGMTVEYLLNRSHKVGAGDTVLFHAAAGGVGLIAGQWLKHIGATAIGTVGSEEKAELARAAGYTHVINYSTTDFAEAVADLTGGAGVDVVYDSVGQATFRGSLASLKKFGLFVSFGQSSGLITDFAVGDLAKAGSLYLQRPTLFSYIDSAENLDAIVGNLFAMISAGHLEISVNQRYQLKDAAAAFEALVGRKTTGATVFDTGR